MPQRDRSTLHIVKIRAPQLIHRVFELPYSLRGPVNITMNDQSANGYIEQYTVPVDVIEQMFLRSEERWEAMTKQLMELLVRATK